MGRLLLLAALSQVLSVLCLAYYGYSVITAWFSYTLALGTVIYIYHTATKARAKDFHMHEYWALRLVGYLEAISGQRLWFALLWWYQQLGVARFLEHPPYPQLEKDSPQSLIDAVVMRMFDHTFSASVGTELYLAAAVKGNAFGSKGIMSEVQHGSRKGDYSKLSTHNTERMKNFIMTKMAKTCYSAVANAMESVHCIDLALSF